MSPPPRSSTSPCARSTTQRRAAAACSLFALSVACGGRSHDPHSASDGGAVASNVASGAGSAGTSGASGEAGTPNVHDGQTMCWLWDALKNRPNSGASGIEACPRFYELEFVVRENCVYKVTDQSPVPPDATATGDCCYAITEYSCR